MSQLISLLLVLTLAAPPALPQAHVVSPAELRDAARDAAAARQANRATLEKFFSSEVARKAGIDAKKLTQAVALLSDEEAARLAARAAQVERDFKAGALSNQELTYIVIALATAVFILIIVVAAD